MTAAASSPARRLRPAVGLLTAALTAAGPLGCFVDIADFAGRACELPAHDCVGGRICVAGRCVAPSADGGLGEGLRWQQWVDGFTALERCAGCGLSIDTDNRNKVNAAILSAADGEDRALALAAQEQVRALGPEGRLRGKFLLPAGFKPAANVPVVQLLTRNAGVFIELYLTPAGQLACYSSANTLQAAPVTTPTLNAPALALDQEHVVEVAWRKGRFRNLALDGAPYLEQPLTENSNPDAAVQALGLGFARYEGSADTGLSLLLWDWQLSANPDVPLMDAD